MPKHLDLHVWRGRVTRYTAVEKRWVLVGDTGPCRACLPSVARCPGRLPADAEQCGRCRRTAEVWRREDDNVDWKGPDPFQW